MYQTGIGADHKAGMAMQSGEKRTGRAGRQGGQSQSDYG
jgi:hypothetical protein